MDTALSNPQYIIDAKGHKTAVILPLEAYNVLLEDLADLIAVAERRDEGTILHKDLLLELKADGII